MSPRAWRFALLFAALFWAPLVAWVSGVPAYRIATIAVQAGLWLGIAVAVRTEWRAQRSVGQRRKSRVL